MNSSLHGSASAWRRGVAIIAARESVEQLQSTLLAACVAGADDSIRSVLDVLVNGNESLAEQTADRLRRQFTLPYSGLTVRIWSIAQGDKAHAWNEYVHRVAPRDARFLHFIDGYARVWPSSIRLLEQALEEGSDYLAATGVPTSGRSAPALKREMLAHGGMHGNMCSLTAQALVKVREVGFRLPLGIYRTDSTLSAALSFGLDPSVNRWEPKRRIAVHPEASWDVDGRKFWRLAEWRSSWSRRKRQAQGRIENLAVEEIFRVQGRTIESLPLLASTLIGDWVAQNPEHFKRLLRQDPWLKSALAQALGPRDWSAAQIAPRLVLERGPAILQAG